MIGGRNEKDLYINNFWSNEYGFNNWNMYAN